MKHGENENVLLKNIDQDCEQIRDLPCSWIGSLNIEVYIWCDSNPNSFVFQFDKMVWRFITEG